VHGEEFWRPVPAAPPAGAGAAPPAYYGGYGYSYGALRPSATLRDLLVEDGDLVLLQDVAVPLLRRTRAEEAAHAFQARSPPPPRYAGGGNATSAAATYNYATGAAWKAGGGVGGGGGGSSYPKAKEKALKINAGGSKAKAAEEAKAAEAAEAASADKAKAAEARRAANAGGAGGANGPRIIVAGARKPSTAAAVSGGGGGAGGNDDSEEDGDAVAPLAPASARKNAFELAKERAVKPQVNPMFGHSHSRAAAARKAGEEEGEEEVTAPNNGGGMSIFEGMD